MNLENLEASLADIRQSAKDFYARKNGSWKPAEMDTTPYHFIVADRMEKMSRFMMMYGSGPMKFSRDDDSMRVVLEKKEEVKYVVMDELTTFHPDFDFDEPYPEKIQPKPYKYERAHISGYRHKK